MGKFCIDRRVRFVAACGHIKIVQSDFAAVSPARPQRDANMASVPIAAKATLRDPRQRQLRSHSQIALLPVDRDIGVAEPVKGEKRKLAVPAFCLLEAKNVGRRFAQEAGDKFDP